MKSLLIICFGLLLTISCNEKSKQQDIEADEVQESKSGEITAADIESLKILEFGLSIDGQKSVEDWGAFQTMILEIENLKSGDLNFFKQESEIIRTQIGEMNSSIPDNIKSKPIQARLLALNTKLLLMNNLLRLQNISKSEKLESIREFLVAYSNLLLQINKKLELDSNINVQKTQS
ncbi:hypothetical protein [Aegicerativicinus sediminis]|uniref:hypothetical protein n=1 Tax=Aegicerativicinus sediminis TaxID=2893202 RepID=UPI001E559072|nr:hypothetical protein [Aegicerativicinus sediminis]